MPGKVKQACQQIAAGGSAGLVEVSLMHPLDVIKTRFQLQGGVNSPTQYKSMGDCVKTMIRTEGAFALYKGILPPILAETPKRATKFFTFEQYKQLFMFGQPTPSPMTFTLAGLCSGMTEAIVINPFERVKIKLQGEKLKFSEATSAFGTARRIIRKRGIGFEGLNKGITAALGRNGTWNMVYFAFYHNMKTWLPEAKDPKLEFARKFAIGFTGGTLGSIVNIPFDVAKSRIQGDQPVPGVIKYRYCFATIKTVYKEEGFLSLYRGLLPKVMRLGPGGAIMLIVYDNVYEWLQKNT